MAVTNFTEDENQKTFSELFYSAKYIRGVDGEYIFLSTLNVFLFHYSFSGEHSDPSCPAQGNFTSPAAQTPVS